MASSYFTKLQVDKSIVAIAPSAIGVAESTTCSTKGGIKTSEGVLSEGCGVHDCWGIFGQPVAGGVSHL